MTTLDDTVRAGFNVPNGPTLYPTDGSLPTDNILSAFDYLPDESGTLTYPAAATTADVKNPSPTDQPPVTYLQRQGGTQPTVPATGVTAGSPGALVPANATVPANLAALKADPVIGDSGTNKPGAAWTTGQFINLGTGTAHWDGDSWETGSAT
jgi:hypothetical protein